MLENCVLIPRSEALAWLPSRSRFLGVNQSGHAVVISLCDKSKGPVECSLNEIRQALEAGVLAIESPDETPDSRRAAEDLSESAKAVFDFWKPHVAPLLQGAAWLQMLEQRSRAALIAALAAETKKPEITARRILYGVLRAGGSLLGLCQNFHLRGGRGKPQKKGSGRRGRKALRGSLRSQLSLPEVRNALEDSARRMSDGDSVSAAYISMIAEKFSETVVEPNGTVVRQAQHESRLPTQKQFRYVVNRLKTQSAPKKSTRSPRGGKAKDGIPGPGYLYEIDATGGRIELVSDFDLKQRIGSATAYGILDVWSTACVGGVLGVFHAGYEAAQRALFNTFTSKRELCARWDIDISDEMWPCHHVPRYLVGDRGEMVSDAAEALPEELNVDLRTPPPYSPQMKGTVEGWFSALKSGDIRKLIGFGRRPQRGERDPRDQAALTRYDGMRAFLLLAIQHNHRPAPAVAIPPQMIEDGYEKISRVTLWRWGQLNLVSGARIEDPRLIYTSMLEKVDAAIREDGLYIKGIRYMSPALRESGLLQRAAERGAIDVQATVDEFAGHVVWYRTDVDAPWNEAYLEDQTLKAYCATLTELSDYYRQRRTIVERTRIGAAVFDTSIGQELGAISDNAVARQGGKSAKRGGKGNIRQARAVDARDERQEHGARIVGSYVSKPPTIQAPAPAPSPTPRASAAELQLALVRKAFLKAGGG